jgi:2-haloacid dehalogenase
MLRRNNCKRRRPVRHICVFDVNETLLDLRALDPEFQRVFGDAAVRREWFGQLLQSALVTIATNAYSDFGTIAGAALDMVAARRGVTLWDADRAKILSGILTLPPHPEVRASLQRLRAAGFRLATLTNSTLRVAEAQMINAGLTEFLEAILSADAARRLKPTPEPYQLAAKTLGVEPKEIRLIAAHAWDVAGALRAGCAAAFVARPGMVLDPLAARPDIVGADLSAVAAQIIDMEH